MSRSPGLLKVKWFYVEILKKTMPRFGVDIAGYDIHGGIDGAIGLMRFTQRRRKI